MNEQRPEDTDASTERSLGWGIVALFLVLHVIIGAGVLSVGGERREPTVGDPLALWAGLGFLLWGTAFVIADRAEHRSILFRVLNGARGAVVLGCLFLAFALFLLGRYVGLL